jgi:hypothetical protein
MVDDTDRLRELAHRLWIAEGRPDMPRRELMRRASDILARQERALKAAKAARADAVPFPAAVSEH